MLASCLRRRIPLWHTWAKGREGREITIDGTAIMDQTAIAEKLREYAKMLLEVANEIHLAGGASVHDAHEIM